MEEMYRVIFTLEDGRRIYAMHRGEVLEWTKGEILNLYHNCRRYGFPAFSKENSKTIRVIDVEYENVSSTIKKRFLRYAND